jgi:hypothetical protein
MTPAEERERSHATTEIEPAVAWSDLFIAALTAPANDNYSAPATASSGSVRFTLHQATRGSEGQNATACWSTGGVDQDVWFKFEADQTGVWTMSLCATETDFDSRIVVYECEENEPPSTVVACDDDGCSEVKTGIHASASFYAEQGEVFYIQVGATDSPETVEVVMDITVD